MAASPKDMLKSRFGLRRFHTKVDSTDLDKSSDLYESPPDKTGLLWYDLANHKAVCEIVG